MSQKKAGVAIDIDDTIAATSMACTQILLHEFGHTTSASELLKQYGYPHHIPEWQLPEITNRLHQILQEETFFESIPPLNDSVEKLHQLLQKIPICCYITSRLENLQSVTEKWLSANNFPKATVICRPSHIVAPDWKVRYLVEKKFPLQALIDNELYVPLDVEIPFQLLELVQSKKVSPQSSLLVQCTSWDEIITELESN